jgi:hypothetical protein
MSANTFAMFHRKPRSPRRVVLSSRLRSLGRAIACVVAVTGLSTLWVWPPGAGPTVGDDLTVEQRQALYRSTRANLELLCEPRSTPNLEAYCREQARLLAQLPECDESCASLVRDQLAWATR